MESFPGKMDADKNDADGENMNEKDTDVKESIHTIHTVQNQAAASAEELLQITEEIGSIILPLYGKVSNDIFEVQCRFALARLQRLNEKWKGWEKELECSLAVLSGQENASGKTDLLLSQYRSSAEVSLQLIRQYLLIARQKEELLAQLLSHSEQIQIRLDIAGELEKQAEIVRLQQALQDMKKI